MTDKLNTGIRIPIWAFGLLVTVIMAIFSWGVATASRSSAVNKQVEVNTNILNSEIKPTLNNKVDKDQYNKDTQDVKDSLSEIKTLLYQHMGIK